MSSTSLAPAPGTKRSLAAFRRARICIDCRTLLGPDERCDGGLAHRVTSLETPEGRAKLVDEVWGPPDARRRAQQLAKAGGGGLGLGSVLEGGCGGCDAIGSEAFFAVIAIVIVAAVVIGVVWLVMKIVEWIRAYMNRPKPHGGLKRPASIGRRGAISGVVQWPAKLDAPATNADCVAWALDLRCKRFLRADLMMHDAETAGFEVKLDDGTTARIPAGRIRLEGPAERLDRSDAPELEKFVKTLAPDVQGPEEFTPHLEVFPYDTVDEVLVRPGDRVQIFGELEREMDPGANVGYRESGAVLVPKGVPAIRVER
ncbi:hypothetical protein [Polyangium aurulentum]|uniref:hypothetical protein n=1 Tax=Polyangium aurulentum TaxID=2567896 RepID=UPI0010AE5FCA|nr:hypothetical protein [Polyangium aurulentum]UQA60179.1 hypothetical protein E8A73_006785 [Polyangium aurulentum]